MESNAVIQRGLDLALAGRADAARAKLHDLAHMRHFRSAAHVARQALRLAAHIITPVDMRVDLQDRDRATVKTAIGFKHRDRHGIITAKNKGHAAGVEQAGHRTTYHRAIARGDFRRGIGHGVEIAEIGGDDAVGQHAV